MITRHIAIVCRELSPARFAGTQALLLAERLAARGHRVSMLCAADRMQALPDGIQRYRPQPRRLHYLFRRRRFLKWQTQMREDLQPDLAIALTPSIPADIIIPGEGWALDYAAALRGLNAPPPTRINAWLSASMPGMRSRIHAERAAVSGPSTRACVVMNEAVGEGLARLSGTAQPELLRATPIARGFSHGTASLTSEALRAQLGRALGIDDGSAWVVFPFHHPWLGGIEPMLLAFKALVDGGVDAVLLLAGRWRYTHPAWIAQLGIRDRVRYVGWPDEPERLMGVADLVVSPASYDPAGWAAHMAVDQGRPVVTTEASGAAQRVRQNGGAVLGYPVDPGELARVIAQRLTGGSERPQGDLEAPEPGQTPAPPLDEVVAGLISSETPG